MKETTKISIVTVTYNCKDTVEKTIQNVLKQTYPNIEYIVIDGNSTDGTKEIIERYADRLAYWVSEPDKGIFDAMNKAIRIATGEWILFLNSGDYFIKPTIIDEVFKWYNDNGETLIAGGTRNYIKEDILIACIRLLIKMYGTDQYSDTKVLLHDCQSIRNICSPRSLE